GPGAQGVEGPHHEDNHPDPQEDEPPPEEAGGPDTGRGEEHGRTTATEATRGRRDRSDLGSAAPERLIGISRSGYSEPHGEKGGRVVRCPTTAQKGRWQPWRACPRPATASPTSWPRSWPTKDSISKPSSWRPRAAARSSGWWSTPTAV